MSLLTGVLLAIHIVVCIALIGVILLQRSEGGALGMGGGGGGGFMTARGAGNLLTRTTAVLGTVFFALSLTLTLLQGGRTAESVTDRIDVRGVDPSNLGGPTLGAPLPGAPGSIAPATTGLPTAPGTVLPAPPAAAGAPLEAPRPAAAAPAETQPAAPAQ